LELNILDSNLTLTLIQDFDEGYVATAMSILGDYVVFVLTGNLWVSDGVTATLILETYDYFTTEPSVATVFKDKLYILSLNNIFFTNATAAGTGPLLVDFRSLTLGTLSWLRTNFAFSH
jgi:hypothetical protein